jgi:hypothetical protein
VSTAVLEQEVTARWGRILATAGRLDHFRDLGDEPAAGAVQAEVAELFVHAEPAARIAFDLFLAALATYRDRPGPELRVVGPEAIRGRSRPSSSGTAVTDLPIVPPSTALAAVSLLLLRVPRKPRLLDLAATVEDLARMADAGRDRDGSAATADAAVRRLEVLVGSDGVSAVLAGDVPAGPGHRLLTEPEAAGVLRDGRLVGPDGAPWREADFALLRVGSPRRRGDQRRSLDTLRRESALVEVELEVGAPDEEESYSARVARARQSSRAAQIVGFARADDSSGAGQVLRAALTQPEADGSLVESLAARVASVDEFWWIRDALLEIEDDSEVGGSLLAMVKSVRIRYERRLDALLASTPQVDDYGAELFIPVVTPIVLEIGDELVPIVDAQLDDGVFLYQLIPEAKDRLEGRLGVKLPGIRARGNPNLPPEAFQVQVYEVPALEGDVRVEAEYVVLPVDAPEPFSDQDLTDFHPLTGEPGLFRVALASSDEDHGERLTSAQYLIHRVERVLRRHLDRYLGPQEVATRVDDWAAGDRTGLVAAVVPDRRARERLTWVLKALVQDGVPITDWRAILEAIRDAGGTDAPIRVLRRAARGRLRDQLPGPRAGDRLLQLPESLSTSALGPARVDLLDWLRTSVAGAGPAISIVTQTQDQREAVAPIARGFSALITTFAADELDGDGG